MESCKFMRVRGIGEGLVRVCMYVCVSVCVSVCECVHGWFTSKLNRITLDLHCYWTNPHHSIGGGYSGTGQPEVSARLGSGSG